MTATRIRELGAHVRIGFPPLLSPILRRRVLGITFGTVVWINPRVVEKAPELLQTILAHELVHVAQYRREGVVRFLLRYLGEYLRARLSGLSHHDAYRSVSYEREAWGSDDEV